MRQVSVVPSCRSAERSGTAGAGGRVIGRLVDLDLGHRLEILRPGSAEGERIDAAGGCRGEQRAAAAISKGRKLGTPSAITSGYAYVETRPVVLDTTMRTSGRRNRNFKMRPVRVH